MKRYTKLSNHVCYFKVTLSKASQIFSQRWLNSLSSKQINEITRKALDAYNLLQKPISQFVIQKYSRFLLCQCLSASVSLVNYYFLFAIV